MFLPGDIFVTRNQDERLNRTPGYWNHVAIYTDNGIIEGQSYPWKSVICSEITEFQNRYYKFRVYRWNEEVGKNAAIIAKHLVGRLYRRYKFNCVTVVRSAYYKALGYDPKWRRPDNFVRDKRLTLIYSKEDSA